MNLQEIQEIAKSEIEHEEFRRAVDKCKEKIRAKRWWHKLMPFKIVIIKRS